MHTFESMHRRPAVGGAEVDAFSPESKRALKWDRSERAWIKRNARRRSRRTTRQQMRCGRY